MKVNILEAIQDDEIFRPFLGDDLESWANWFVILRALYGRKIRSRRSIQFFKQATGRDAAKLPADGFSQMLALVGRRSGKSRITALVAAFESAIGERWKRCAAGETPVVAVISPRKVQSRVITNYLKAIFDAPLLRNEVVGEHAEGVSLRNGVSIQILAGDGGVAIRGTTAICICLDEVAWHGVDVECKIRNDMDLVRACLPSLATTDGKLIAISSPYQRKGWCFDEFTRAFGNDRAKDILVVNGPSRLFNPTLPQSVVDAALRRDLQGAKSEFLGEFRDSISAFIGRDLVEACVVPGRKELMPTDDEFIATVDMSGGRHDASCLCIGRKHRDTIVVHLLRHVPAPHEPHAIVQQFVKDCRKFNVRSVIGDSFGGDWVSGAFNRAGLDYERAEHTASEAFLELLPVICTPDALELLDCKVLVDELCSLERRTRSSGKDLVAAPAGSNHHDDAANVLALLVAELNTEKVRVGAF